METHAYKKYKQNIVNYVILITIEYLHTRNLMPKLLSIIKISSEILFHYKFSFMNNCFFLGFFDILWVVINGLMSTSEMELGANDKELGIHANTYDTNYDECSESHCFFQNKSITNIGM